MPLPLLPLLAIGALVGGYGTAAVAPDKILPGVKPRDKSSLKAEVAELRAEIDALKRERRS